MRALELGADGVELDVHATKDGVVVVHHDEVPRAAAPSGRLTGKRIDALTFAELQGFAVRGTALIPTLAEVLPRCATAPRCTWSSRARASRRATIDVIRTSPNPGDAPCTASITTPFVGARALAPELRGGILFDRPLDAVAAAMRAADALDAWQEGSHRRGDWSRRCTAPAASIIAWTVESHRTRRRAGVVGRGRDVHRPPSAHAADAARNGASVMTASTPAVAVIGAGTMGHGIAYVSALAGCRVCTDRRATPTQLTRGARQIERTSRRPSRGQVHRRPTRRRARAAHRRADGRRMRVRDATLVIEAVPERLDLKQRLFAALERVVPADALLATNTSSLSIAADRRGRCAHPARVVGHALLQSGARDEAARDRAPRRRPTDARSTRARAFARRLGKRADRRARLARLRVEPARRRARPRGDADARAGRGERGGHRPRDGAGLQPPDGPARADRPGRPRRAARDRRVSARDPAATPPTGRPQILRDKVARGKLGKKTGKGFYRWETEP